MSTISPNGNGHIRVKCERCGFEFKVAGYTYDGVVSIWPQFDGHNCFKREGVVVNAN